MPELLKCPFCGGDSAKIERSSSGNDDTIALVKCADCGAQSPRFAGAATKEGWRRTRGLAFAAWNRRAMPNEDEALYVERKALKAALKRMVAIGYTHEDGCRPSDCLHTDGCREKKAALEQARIALRAVEG